MVDLGAGALDDAECADQRAGHALGADAEVLGRALGLRAPVAISRHLDRAEGFALGPGASLGLFSGEGLGHHFLRKRSSRTTSAPPLSDGLSSDLSAATGSGLAGTLVALASLGSWRCGVRRLLAGGLSVSASVSSPSSSGASARLSNCRVNCTDGSAKPLIASNGMTSRSATPPKERPTSNASSVTLRSQNWCCSTTVISSGYCARSRGDSCTPSALVSKVMKK